MNIVRQTVVGLKQKVWIMWFISKS